MQSASLNFAIFATAGILYFSSRQRARNRVGVRDSHLVEEFSQVSIFSPSKFRKRRALALPGYTTYTTWISESARKDGQVFLCTLEDRASFGRLARYSKVSDMRQIRNPKQNSIQVSPMLYGNSTSPSNIQFSGSNTS